MKNKDTRIHACGNYRCRWNNRSRCSFEEVALNEVGKCILFCSKEELGIKEESGIKEDYSNIFIKGK